LASNLHIQVQDCALAGLSIDSEPVVFEERKAMETHPRVLIVDDEASLRRQLTVGLAQHGYEVDECEEGLPALTKIKAARSRQNPFTCVILDIRLPDIDGLKILSVLKSAYPDLPVVVITGYGDRDTVNNVQSRAGSAYLDKPFDVEELVSELERIGTRVAGKSRPKVAVEPQVLASAFLFVRGTKDADLPEIFARLNYEEGVCYCDPVMGDWDVVLLVQAPDRAGINQLVRSALASVEGVESSEIHFCEKPGISREFEEFLQDYEKSQAMERTGGVQMDTRNVRMFTSYAILDTDPAQLANLYMKLYFTDNVVHSDVTDGGSQIILLMQGVSAQEIQSTIRKEIRLMPGVLRIKQLNALSFATK
jgi:CheY-like chemotaxis protein